MPTRRTCPWSETLDLARALKTRLQKKDAAVRRARDIRAAQLELERRRRLQQRLRRLLQVVQVGVGRVVAAAHRRVVRPPEAEGPAPDDLRLQAVDREVRQKAGGEEVRHRDAAAAMIALNARASAPPLGHSGSAARGSGEVIWEIR